MVKNIMPDSEKYSALIRAVESRFARAWKAYYDDHAAILIGLEKHLKETVPLPEDERAISTNPEAFEQALAVAHARFVERHPELPAIEGEGCKIHARRGEEMSQIKADFMAAGGDENSFQELHESVLSGRRTLNADAQTPKP